MVPRAFTETRTPKQSTVAQEVPSLNRKKPWDGPDSDSCFESESWLRQTSSAHSDQLCEEMHSMNRTWTTLTLTLPNLQRLFWPLTLWTSVLAAPLMLRPHSKYCCRAMLPRLRSCCHHVAHCHGDDADPRQSSLSSLLFWMCSHSWVWSSAD